MTYLLIALVALGAVAALASFLTRDNDDGADTPAVPQCGTCTGENTRCEQECMMEAAVRDIEYYDDEELDRFRGRSSDDYTDDEVQEFAEVLYTMRVEEVAGWNRSLILRGVNIPDRLKDEVIMMIDGK